MNFVRLLAPLIRALEPSPPPRARITREEHPMSEAVLQRQVLAHLRQLPNSFFWRANTGGAKAGEGFIKFGINGQSDIMGVAAGHAVFIELKSKSGRQSPEQREFQARVESGGGIYVLARTLDQALSPVRALLG